MLGSQQAPTLLPLLHFFLWDGKVSLLGGAREGSQPGYLHTGRRHFLTASALLWEKQLNPSPESLVSLSPEFVGVRQAAHPRVSAL